MPRQANNTRKCIECGAEVPRKVKRCPPCNQAFLKVRGTYERTDEHKHLMSEVTTGKPKAHRPASERPEVAAKIRESWTEEKREAARTRGLQFALDPEWRMKIALSVAGPNNPRWEDGRAVLPYTPGFGAKIRELVAERDGHKCVRCGATRSLCVHHKDFAKHDHRIENLELMCRRCHVREHVRHSKS